MNTIRQRWEALASREQLTLGLGAMALLLILGYVLLWEPLAQSRDDWRTRVVSSESDLAWMRAAAPRVQANRGTDVPAGMRDNRSLLARVDASAREAGLGDVLLRVEPVSSGQVRVQFERAGFDALVRWLEDLSTRYGTRVTELSATRSEGVGLVDARLSLDEAGPP
jgi:general secretion pathway protein M